MKALALPLAAFAVGAMLAVLCEGCSDFSIPSETLDAVADYALLQTIPEPGPRPASFECELLDVTASGDHPNITTFRHEGFEPVTVYSEDEITDVHMSGVRVVVVGDVFIVGEHWVRLGSCE